MLAAETAYRWPEDQLQEGFWRRQAGKEVEPATSMVPWIETCMRASERRQRALAYAQGTAAVDDSECRAPNPTEVHCGLTHSTLRIICTLNPKPSGLLCCKASS